MLEKLRAKLPKVELKPAKFYKVGVYCFGIIAVFNTFSFITNVTSGVDFGFIQVVTGGARLVFNYALWGFFYYLKGTVPPENLEQGTMEEMEKMILEETKEVKTKWKKLKL